MGKRSNFERIERDFYPTPRKAIEPLADWFNAGDSEGWFAEPCYGAGDLSDALTELTDLQCGFACDIAPQDVRIETRDALTITADSVAHCDFIVTNPPWSRDVLHPMIEHFSRLKPTWLLFDADWMHTIQSRPYMQWLDTIISVGRIKWVPGTKYTSKDNCCWYLFDQRKFNDSIEFIGRT